MSQHFLTKFEIKKNIKIVSVKNEEEMRLCGGVEWKECRLFGWPPIDDDFSLVVLDSTRPGYESCKVGIVENGLRCPIRQLTPSVLLCSRFLK